MSLEGHHRDRSEIVRYFKERNKKDFLFKVKEIKWLNLMSTLIQ